MNKLIFIPALLLLLSGCFGQTEDTPAYSGSPFEIPNPPKSHVVRCNTVEGANPDDACSSKQPNIMRCTAEIENPDADHCTGPTADMKQVSGSVWCCAPAF